MQGAIQRNMSAAPGVDPLTAFVSGFSIEVMPRTAEKVADFRALLPPGIRVYIAHIDGTSDDDMVATARRLRGDGFEVMPHVPARSIASVADLAALLERYRAAGIDQALLLAGGATRPAGTLTSSIDMIETGLFERLGFERLHVAGHPEGNRSAETGGAPVSADDALAYKQEYAARTGIEMAVVTQFVFDAQPVIAWAERIAGQGIHLPIHVGVAGPAKLQTLLKYAVACGVGPSLKVLQRRAADLTRLLVPFEPLEVLSDLAAYRAAHPQSRIVQPHFFPLGGIAAAADWATARTRTS